MTDPAPATPATDPATPPTDPATPPAAPVDPAPAAPVTDPPADPADESDPRVKRANEQAAAARIALRDTKAELEAKIAEQGKTLAALAAVFSPGTPEADPAQVAEQATAKVSTLESENSSLRAQLLVHELATDQSLNLGANPVALLDSRRFTDALIQLDQGAEDYRDKVAEAIKSAVQSTPSLRAAGQVPSAGGSETAGQGAGSGAAVTADQFAAMTYAQRTELYRTNPALYQQLRAAGTAT